MRDNFYIETIKTHLIEMNENNNDDEYKKMVLYNYKYLLTEALDLVNMEIHGRSIIKLYGDKLKEFIKGIRK